MTFLLLLLVQLQHGVQLVREVRQHGAYVLQHVPRRPSGGINTLSVKLHRSVALNITFSERILDFPDVVGVSQAR